ncbi:conserved exported hypothetical protein [uncultured delta proteobacterium]|uniref:UPF0391 membrane protein KL86DPRO_20275 n=1 Tax=uncultured delta proteobacterium TaxID=34034 RepID=A0A212JXJ7_9DELT|nr:conserved exported hypothetical protein [uncultured delta proteobacterium]
MLSWGIWALVIAVVAGLLGFTGIAGAASFVAKAIFGLCLFVFVISILIAKSIL